MSPKIRIFTIALWAVAILGMVGLLASWTTSHFISRANPPPAAEVLHVDDSAMPVMPVPAFSLTDQEHQLFTLNDLKGKVWIADFIFTTCTGPCPLLTQKMSQLAKQLSNPDIQFVSFSIDPDTDTPAVMKAYKAKFSDDPRWHFLTGPDNATYNIAKALKLPAVPATGDNPIFHTTKFTLISPAGDVAGYYDYNDPAELTKLASDARSLASH